jgi:Rieske Fe-S protein
MVGSRTDPPAPSGASRAGCPFAGNGPFAPVSHATSGPVGVLRRVAALDRPDAGDDDRVDENRRNFLKLALIAGAVAAGAAGGASLLRYVEPPPRGAATYPRVQLFYADASPVLVSAYPYGPTSTELVVFDYPLTNEPNMLLNLATAAPNGVGPNGTLVAYSAICQHLGSLLPNISYYPAGACGTFYGGKAFIHCIIHGSTYDPALAASGGGAAVITGPAVLPLPQLLLEWDSATDYLFAVGVIGPPVFGHTSTLLGGSVVAPPVELATQTPNQQCPT